MQQLLRPSCHIQSRGIDRPWFSRQQDYLSRHDYCESVGMKILLSTWFSVLLATSHGMWTSPECQINIRSADCLSLGQSMGHTYAFTRFGRIRIDRSEPCDKNRGVCTMSRELYAVMPVLRILSRGSLVY